MRYVSIANNERNPGGPSVAKVLLPPGHEDGLDVAGVRRLVVRQREEAALTQRQQMSSGRAAFGSGSRLAVSGHDRDTALGAEDRPVPGWREQGW